MMRKIIRRFASATILATALSALAIATVPISAQAAVYTYTFDPGAVVDFNDGTHALSTLSGAFTVDTTAELVTSSSITLSGPALAAGLYDQGGTADSALGFIDLKDITGLLELTLAFRSPFGAPVLSLGSGAAIEVITGVGGFQSGEETQGGITLAAAVPEPSTWAMLILGFAGIGFVAYRRKSKPAFTAGQCTSLTFA
jgi:hypothetical protein